MHIIYGLRRSGSSQVRYIGRTNRPEERLAAHLKNAREKPIYLVHDWIASLDGDVEIIELARHADRQKAIAAERETIRAYAFAGHNLANVRMNPKRVDTYRTRAA